MLPLLRLIPNIYTSITFEVILYVLSSIGGGLICSALVAIIIEKLHEKLEIVSVEKQRRFIFSYLQRDLLHILSFENKNLSEYFLINNEGHKKTNKSELSISDSLLLLQNKLAMVIELQGDQTGTIIIDKNWMKNQDATKSCLMSISLPYYKRLMSDMNSIIINKDTYFINNVLDEQTFERLTSEYYLLEDIIRFSEENAIDLVVEEKKLFYDDMLKLLQSLKVNIEEKITVYERKLIN